MQSFVDIYKKNLCKNVHWIPEDVLTPMLTSISGLFVTSSFWQLFSNFKIILSKITLYSAVWDNKKWLFVNLFILHLKKKKFEKLSHLIAYNNFRNVWLYYLWRHKPQNDNYRVVTNLVTFPRVYFPKSHKIVTIKDRDLKFEIQIIWVIENTPPKEFPATGPTLLRGKPFEPPLQYG